MRMGPKGRVRDFFEAILGIYRKMGATTCLGSNLIRRSEKAGRGNLAKCAGSGFWRAVTAGHLSKISGSGQPA
eukprot:1141656-Pelagomonas_calceolata.AAC.6